MPALQDPRIVARVMTRRAGGGGEPGARERFEELGPFETEATAREAAREEDVRRAGVVVHQQWRYPHRPRWVDVREIYTENA